MNETRLGSGWFEVRLGLFGLVYLSFGKWKEERKINIEQGSALAGNVQVRTGYLIIKLVEAQPKSDSYTGQVWAS